MKVKLLLCNGLGEIQRFVSKVKFKRDQLANKEQVELDDQDDDTAFKKRRGGKLERGEVDTDEIYVMKLRWRGNYYNFIVVQTSMAVMMSHRHDEWPIRKHQIIVNAQDDDTGDVFLMKLKWRGSYYNLIGKWGQIIRGKTLEVGQEIRVRWDNGYLVFSVA
ncbi:hypothetical protein Tco_0782712 [Tanacetum coccineum]